jgi:hypothetical protein
MMPGSLDASSAVAEQHAGRTVAPIDHARQRLGTDHQRFLRLSAAHELIRDA